MNQTYILTCGDSLVAKGTRDFIWRMADLMGLIDYSMHPPELMVGYHVGLDPDRMPIRRENVVDLSH